MNSKSTFSLALIALAMLIVMTSAILTTDSAQAATAHNKTIVKTTVRLRVATQIANTTLSPGKYKVKIVPASNGSGDPTLQFSIGYNPYGDETNPDEDEIVLTVQASTVDMRTPAARTELISTSADNNKASALEIRGSNTEYLFGSKTTSAANMH